MSDIAAQSAGLYFINNTVNEHSKTQQTLRSVKAPHLGYITRLRGEIRSVETKQKTGKGENGKKKVKVTLRNFVGLNAVA